MDFSLPDYECEFYPDASVGDGVFLIPEEDVMHRPADNEILLRDRNND